ncbi:hypothetical protein DVH24_034599 [Malus domestica]|uniref:Uncharacterized protein n=1 Tax=Malus domestica TaxID=3750 RepID=A0A498IWC2_MALDO|nr:hypothetical protein DVH24_034599 [Malus domestica]
MDVVQTLGFTVEFTLFQDPSDFVHQHLAPSVGIDTKSYVGSLSFFHLTIVHHSSISILLDKQKAQDIVAQLVSDTESKHPRVEEKHPYCQPSLVYNPPSSAKKKMRKMASRGIQSSVVSAFTQVLGSPLQRVRMLCPLSTLR